jgi:DNA (cytosine-5)-methyltransferase 1
MPEERSDGRTNALTSVRKDNIVSIDSGIRYLTPLECERLMGWPDNWTKYGIDGNGKTVVLPDHARYSLIGNGVVPQVVRELIGQIMCPGTTGEGIKDEEVPEVILK